ncbi:MAG: cytochrome c maturation protein CcmE [Alphaproteobacteria bacterium]|nr:cytochrome c maturation protein CcmE [Alphaproteobacteria bacterium]
MRKRSQRLWLIGAAGLLVASGVALAATALKDTVAYFYSPSDLVEKNAAQAGRSARVGGLVEAGSVRRGEGAAVEFRITDGSHAAEVSFDGLLPDLFEEGQGIVAEGRFDGSGRLVAERVLAKHDENYMPREVYEALKEKAGAAAPASYEARPAGAPAT